MRRYRDGSENALKDRRFLIICLILIFMIAVSSAFVSKRLKPIGFELARAYGSDAVLKAINDSVGGMFDDLDIGYSDLVRLKYNSSGMVTSIEYNAGEITRLKLKCSDILSKNLSKLKSAKIKIPIGSLFGDISLSGRGPSLSVKLSSKAVPTVELISKLESSGVNQSRHDIIMRVTADVSVYLPPESKSFTVTQDYVLAQTVIAGDVPQGNILIE